MSRQSKRSGRDREWIRQVMIAVSEAAGTHRLECPDYPRCYYAVASKDLARCEADMADHLANDARHTGGEWTDRDGRERVGLGYADS